MEGEGTCHMKGGKACSKLQMEESKQCILETANTLVQLEHIALGRGNETEKMSMRRREGKSKGRGRTRAKWLLPSTSSLYRREWGAIDTFEGE